MLVELPSGDDWVDTGEGGLAFFLLVPLKEDGIQRQICIAGGIRWPRQDVAFPSRWWEGDEGLDAGLLIGSTGQSLWSEGLGKYFMPSLANLTEEGKQLYWLLKRLYGDVQIVTLLDT